MFRRVLFGSAGDDGALLQRLETRLGSHFSGILPFEFRRLGNVASLAEAYANVAQSDGDDETLLIFVHQDAFPFATPEESNRELSSLLPPLAWLRDALNPPHRWLRIALALCAMPSTGILGVAGACSLSRACVWWREPLLSGAVLHRLSERCAINPYGPWGRVAVLDGVCMIARGSVWRSLILSSSSRARFHFYDIEYSLRAHLAGLRNFTVPLLLVHESGGNVTEDSGWERDRASFCREYADYLPAAVPYESLPLSLP